MKIWWRYNVSYRNPQKMLSHRRFFFRILINSLRPFISEVLYLHQTFTICVFDWCTHFGRSTRQMWLQVMEVCCIITCLKRYLHKTFTNCVLRQNKCRDENYSFIVTWGIAQEFKPFCLSRKWKENVTVRITKYTSYLFED